MYAVDVDLILRFVPPMSDTDHGIRLTRTIELPFPPVEDISVFSNTWEGIDDPLGYILKNVTWDMDRKRFIADTELSVSGTPIAMIPQEIVHLVYHGWTYGSYKDSYTTERKRGRKRTKLPSLSDYDWDPDEATKWETNRRGRPKEFTVILHAVVSTMAELHNNCRVAYAMLKTGTCLEIDDSKLTNELSTVERRFADALNEYDSLTSDQEWDWAEKVKTRYPQLKDVVAAIG